MEECVKISVIIPVYQTGKYIAECLGSLMNQTFREFEVIVVNDGSTDNSWEVIKSFCCCFGKVTCVSQHNQGTIRALDAALRLARGEYILKVDSDDYLHVQALELLYGQAAASNADIITYSLMRFKDEAGDRQFYGRHNGKNSSRLTDKLIKAELYRKVKYEELPSLVYAEDAIVHFIMKFYQPVYHYYEKALYFWRTHPEQSVQFYNEERQHRYSADFIAAYEYLKKRIIEEEVDQSFLRKLPDWFKGRMEYQKKNELIYQTMSKYYTEQIRLKK